MQCKKNPEKKSTKTFFKMKRKMKSKHYWAGITDNKVKVGWSKYDKHVSCEPEVLKVSEISFSKKQWIYFRSIVDDMFKEHYL